MSAIIVKGNLIGLYSWLTDIHILYRERLGKTLLTQVRRLGSPIICLLQIENPTSVMTQSKAQKPETPRANDVQPWSSEQSGRDKMS